MALGAAGGVVLLGGDAAFPAEALAGFACAVGAAATSGRSTPYWRERRASPTVPTEAAVVLPRLRSALALAAHLALEAPAALDARQWLVVALLGLGPTGAAFFLWDHGMKRGDPRLLGALAYAVPVAATLLLVAIGEGALSTRMLVAAALVSGGGLLSALAGRRRRGDPA